MWRVICLPSRSARPELLAWLYGASELETKVEGTTVCIVQKTDYPFSDRIVFQIEPAQPVDLDLVLRIPPNSGTVQITAEGAKIEMDEKTIRISKRWSKGDTISVNFDFQTRRALQHDQKQAFYEWGPLVFALPIDPVVTPWQEIKKNGTPTGYFDFLLKPSDVAPWRTLDRPDASFRKVDLPGGDLLTPWTKPPVGLEGTLADFEGKPLAVSLVPMGGTTLRRTTFPLTREDAMKANEKQKGKSFKDEDDPMRNF
jgi:hypothetical protein